MASDAGQVTGNSIVPLVACHRRRVTRHSLPQMNTAPAALGIIAGNRSLPLEFARQARAAGVKKLVAVAFENETDPALGAARG